MTECSVWATVTLMWLPVIGSRPRDCLDVLLSGQQDDGVYSVFPTHYPAGFQVYCDMRTDGGGWTVSLVCAFICRGSLPSIFCLIQTIPTPYRHQVSVPSGIRCRVRGAIAPKPWFSGCASVLGEALGCRSTRDL